MGQYCDSKVLEANWFNWLVASSVPELEPYRETGILATKIIGRVKVQTSTGACKISPDPVHPCRAHCIMSTPPIYLNSHRGKLSRPRYFKGKKLVNCKLPKNPVLDESRKQKLLDNGYIIERPTIESWHKMLIDIMRICSGIASKFNLPNEEAKQDLANDALHQVSTKIKNRKLVYIPGKAPVFNLLTTTIHRIIFSLLNKDTKERHNRAKHGELISPLLDYHHSRGRVCTRRVLGVLVANQKR